MKRSLTLTFMLGLLTVGLVAALFFALWATPGGINPPGSIAGQEKPSQPPKPSGPPIRWTPETLVVTLSPGERKTVHATATISSDIPATFTKIVPVLAPYVTVHPSTAPALTAESTQGFDLTFSIPAGTAFGTLDGTLQLRTQVQSKASILGTKRKPSFSNRDGIARAAEPLTQESSTLARPLPITLNIWQEAHMGDSKVDYPPDWIVQTSDGGVAITTLSDPTLLNEDTIHDFAFFNIGFVRPRPGVSPGPANPDALPIDQWFHQYFGGAFSATPTISHLQIAGRPAVRLEIAEADGRHAHIYIADGMNVIEISFPLSSSFVPRYETMLSTIAF